MPQAIEHNFKKSVTNTFGSLGYLFCFLQWFWAVILYFSVLQSVSLFISPANNEPVEQSTDITFTQPDPLMIVILSAFAIIMIIITMYALISIPKTIIKTGSKIVHRTAETITPVIIDARHKQDTKKLRITLTPKLVIVAKLLLIIIPLVLTATSGLLDKQSIDYSIALTLGCGLACFSTIAFIIQYTLAKLLHVKISGIW